jgi:hypothetical protein
LIAVRWKVPDIRVWRLDPLNVTFSKAIQSPKALSPSLVTGPGIFTLVKETQLRQHVSGICVNKGGKSKFSTREQLAKKPGFNDVTELVGSKDMLP